MYRVAISPEMRSKSKMRPLTASSDGGESRRWRMISERPRDAGNEHRRVPHEPPRVIRIEDRNSMSGPRVRELDVAFFDPSYTGRAGLRQFRESFRSERLFGFLRRKQPAKRRTFRRRRRCGTGRLLVLSRVGDGLDGSPLMGWWRGEFILHRPLFSLFTS